MINEEKITQFLKKAKGPVSLIELSRAFRLDRRETKELKKSIKSLRTSGEIVRVKRGLYSVAPEKKLVSGNFELHRDGYGFVITDTPGDKDIFIPARKTAGALNGDSVIVRVDNPHKREGRILKIKERSIQRVVGNLYSMSNGFYVRPIKGKLYSDVFITKKKTIDAGEGDLVVAEIESFMEGSSLPVGKVVKKLTSPQNYKGDLENIIHEFGLPRRFPNKVYDEIRRLPSAFSENELVDRKDLREITTVTIDGEKAMDFDDAVSIEAVKDGYRLYVHIADVSHFVCWECETDLEARKRGTSVYFPDMVIPMLPKKLSENLCSLNEGVDRLTFTVDMFFDKSGGKGDVSFYPSVINSNKRLTYDVVGKILENHDDALIKRYEPLFSELKLMEELCKIIRKKRMDGGSLDFDLPEPEIILDITGNPENILRAERNIAHMLIEEFMIAANESVAERLEDLDLPAIYRVHELPDEKKLENITNLLNSMGYSGKKQIKPSQIPKLLRSMKSHPHEEIINSMVVRSLKQALYSPENVGHFGLASECYTHFTSPIRRYPDLVVHRIMHEVWNRKSMPKKRKKELEGLLKDISPQSSKRERLADEVERETLKAVKCRFMNEKVGEEFEGKIVGMNSNRLSVMLNDYFIEGAIKITDMRGDDYIFNKERLTVVGKYERKKYSLSDTVRVRLDRIDMENRELIFGI